MNNKQTTHSGNVYDRDYVIDYTTVYGIAPTVQNYVLPGDISTAADGWQNDTKTNGLDIQKMLAELNDGFSKLRENGAYIFVYDYLNNILAVNGKSGTAADAEVAKAEDVKLCINDFINHFLGRTVDNSHIIGIGDNNHKLEGYAKFGVGSSDAAAGDTFASFKNSDIMVISPNYFQQKHIYTDRGQRVEQKTDTAANQSGNGGNIKLLYVHEDIMGNTRYHTKDNGQSYAELEYDVWGNPTSPNMLLNNDNGVFIFAVFTGHIYDTVLDIYFAEARFYDAKNRQWLSSDPMKDGLNWYQYVGANPATWWDPWGLAPYSVRATGSINKGKFTLHVTPQSLDTAEFAAGFVPWFTPLNWVAQRTIGGRRLIGYDLSTAAASIFDVTGKIVNNKVIKTISAFAGWTLSAAEALSFLSDWLYQKHYQIEEAIFNQYDRDIWLSDTRDLVDRKFSYAMNEMTYLMLIGEIEVRKAVDYFGEDAFYYNPSLGWVTYQYDPLTGRKTFFHKNDYYFFKLDCSMDNKIADHEKTIKQGVWLD